MSGDFAGDLGLIPGQGTRSHMVQLRVYMPQLRPDAAKRLSDSHFHALSLPTLALPCLIHSTGLVPLSPLPPPLNSLELRGHPQTLQGGSILLVCRWRGSGPWGWGGDQVTLAEPEQEGATVRTLRPESMPLFP